MEEVWIWYGPSDPVGLAQIKQAGAKAISSALYEIEAGEVWPLQQILERKAVIEQAGLTWSVVESIPVHEVIKIGEPAHLWRKYVDNYKQTLTNLATAGLDILSYSFMPLFDWLRTDTEYLWRDGSKALSFSMDSFRVFDLHVLKREGAELSYSKEQVERARLEFGEMSEEEVDRLSKTLIAGLHGQKEYEIEIFRAELDQWKGVTKQQLKQNLINFVSELLEVAETENVLLSLHPDDPPFELLGLPRVASTLPDYEELFSILPSTHNGVTFCMGSLASTHENNVLEMADKLRSRIHFVHLRNVVKTKDGGLVESGHVEGDADMVAVVEVLVREKKERMMEGEMAGAKVRLPMRSDHGHLILGDGGDSLPGHSFMGRMKGLAEIRGVQMAFWKK